MDQLQIMNKAQEILEDAKAAVLTTIDRDGRSHMRWMTPAILKWRPGVMFAITRPEAEKMRRFEANRQVEWMIQSRDLTEIINMRGTIAVLNHAGLKTEIIEQIGDRLAAFWKFDMDCTDCVVLETEIKQAVYYLPMKPSREIVTFQ